MRQEACQREGTSPGSCDTVQPASQAPSPVVCDTPGPSQAQLTGPAWTSSQVVNSARRGRCPSHGSHVSSEVQRPRQQGSGLGSMEMEQYNPGLEQAQLTLIFSLMIRITWDGRVCLLNNQDLLQTF